MGKSNLEVLPREKAIKYGFSSLTDYELLAIIIRTGCKDNNVIELSKQIINEFHGLKFLKSANITDLMKIKGLKKAKALNLLAVFELSKRMNEKLDDIITCNDDAFNLVYPLYESLEQECFYALILNSRNVVLAVRMITKGSLNGQFIDCSDIIRECIKVNGRKLYLFHNHPSGCCLPSESDIITTKDINRKCLLFHINLIDHLIIGNNEYLSIKNYLKVTNEGEKEIASQDESTTRTF